MERIEHALKSGGGLKAVERKLAMGKNQMYAVRDKKGSLTANMVKVVKVAEQFYRDLYSSRDNQDDSGSSPDEFDISPVTTVE